MLSIETDHKPLTPLLPAKNLDELPLGVQRFSPTPHWTSSAEGGQLNLFGGQPFTKILSKRFQNVQYAPTQAVTPRALITISFTRTSLAKSGHRSI